MTSRQEPQMAWMQTDVELARPDLAELTWTAVIGPGMRVAIDSGLLRAWFIVRKRPCLRIRYAAPATDADQARRAVLELLRSPSARPHFRAVRHQIYEPETTAFGGAAGIDLAHRLFVEDTRAVTDYLTRLSTGRHPDRRRELTLLLSTALLRAAGLEWFEQGDVWARVATMRGNPTTLPERPDAATASTRRYLTVSTEPVLARVDEDLVPLLSGWLDDFHETGVGLRRESDRGNLERGLRSILAHHVIFHWNRVGLSFHQQQLLSRNARDAVFVAEPPELPGVHRTEGRLRHG